MNKSFKKLSLDHHFYSQQCRGYATEVQRCSFEQVEKLTMQHFLFMLSCNSPTVIRMAWLHVNVSMSHLSPTPDTLPFTNVTKSKQAFIRTVPFSIAVYSTCHGSRQIEDAPITKTYLYNFDPLKPPFYIVKLGFTGVYIIFLFLLKNILWVLVRTASASRF